MAFDLVLDGNLFYQGRLVKACVGIEGGKIAAVKKILEGARYKDFGYKLIVPAAIDAHVHFREPGLTWKSDFESESASAARGGVSCVFDMPNTKPPVLTASDLEDKFTTVKRRAHVDFGLYAGTSAGMSEGTIESLAKSAIAFKIFMASSTGDMLVNDDGALQRLFAMIAKTGKVVTVHAEDEKMIEQRKKKVVPKNLEDYNNLRNGDVELSAFEKALKLRSGAKLHFAHVSSEKTVALLRRLKNEPAMMNDVTTEVTPHHLFLTEKFMLPSRPSKPGYGKVNPPLRAPSDRNALFDALLDGTLDMVASDHAPHTIEEKEEPDFERVPSGMPGVETSLPLFLSIFKHNYIELPTLVRIFSTKPAETFGLAKGRIEVGYDADLLVIDMHDEEKIKSERVHYKCGWTPFENFYAIYPEQTIVRGNFVVENRELVGDQGLGKMQAGNVSGRSD